MAKKPETLEVIIDRAAEVVAELDTLKAQTGKLSPEAFLRAALAMPGASEKEAKEVLAALDRPENFQLQPSYRRILQKILENTCSSPIPGRLLGAYVTGEGDAVLGRIRCTRESLQAACVMQAIRRSPSRFGNREDLALDRARVSELTAERHRLFESITSELEPLIRFELVNKTIAEDAVNAALAKRTVRKRAA
jgi:hypothetical protein